MININESGILCGSTPRAYVNKVKISPGSAVNYRNGSSTVKARTTAASQQDSDSRTTNVSLELYVQDVVNMRTAKSVWLLSPILRSQMSVKVIQSTNERLTQQLKSQGVNTQVLQGYNVHEDYEIKQSSLAMLSDLDSPTYSVNIGTTKKVYSLIKNISFDVPFEPSHLTYFVFTETRSPDDRDPDGIKEERSPTTVERVIEGGSVVKTAAIFRDSSNRIWSGGVHEHPDFGWMEGYQHSSTPHGNLVREVVSNSKIVDMRIIEKVKNLKINISPTSPQNLGEESRMTSDLYLARNARGYVAGTFTIDYLKFLKSNSKFANLISTSPQRVQNEILSLSKILSFKVVRNRINESQGLNRLNSKTLLAKPLVLDGSRQVVIQTADRNNKLLPRERYSPGNDRFNKFVEVDFGASPPENYNFFGGVEEIRAESMDKKRTFVFSDSLLNTSTGRYKYTLECVVKDGTYEFMNDRIEDIQECLKGVRRYLYNARKPENYNSSSNSFTQDFISSQMDPSKYIIPTPSELPRLVSALSANSGARDVQPWLAAIVKYIETMDLLTEMTDTQRVELTRALYCLLSPVSSSPSDVEKFIFILEDLEKKIYKLTTRKIAHSRDKSDAYRSDRSNENLNMSIEFEEVFDASSLANTGFHYFGSTSETNSMLNIQKENFLDDIQAQLGYIGSAPPDLGTIKSQLKTVSNKATNALFSNSQDLSYMAPSSIQFPNGKIDLWNGDSLDYTSITAVIQNMSRKSTDKLINIKPTSDVLRVLNTVGKGAESDRIKKINNIYVDNAIESGILLENNVPSAKEMPQIVDSEKYLGKTNKFSAALPETEDLTKPSTGYNPEMALAVINNVLNVQNTSTTNNLSGPGTRNISFDLSKENNFLTSELAGAANFTTPKESEGMLTQKISALPSQIKKLALRQDRLYSDAAGSLSTNEDSKADGYMYNFGMIRVVEYLAGYSDDNMRNPVWVKVNPIFLDRLKSNAICRVRKVVIPDVNIGVYDLLDKVPIYNEYFILRGPSPRKPNTRKVQTKIIASENNDGFVKDSLLKSAEKATFVNLVKYEVQQKVTQFSNEYIVTEPPLPGPGTRRSAAPGTPDSATTRAVPAPPRSPAGSRATTSGAMATTRSMPPRGGGSGGY